MTSYNLYDQNDWVNATIETNLSKDKLLEVIGDWKRDDEVWHWDSETTAEHIIF